MVRMAAAQTDGRQVGGSHGYKRTVDRALTQGMADRCLNYGMVCSKVQGRTASASLHGADSRTLILKGF